MTSPLYNNYAFSYVPRETVLIISDVIAESLSVSDNFPVGDVVELEAFSLEWSTIASDNIETRASNANRNSIAPTNPLSSGWTSYEYTGTADSWRIRPWGAMDTAVTNQTNVCRTNVSFDHTNIRVTADLFRYSVDATAQGMLCLFVPTTAIGSYGNGDYIRGGVRRESTSSVTYVIERVDGSGAATILASAGGISFPTNTNQRVIFEKEGNTLRLYSAVAGTGASQTLRVSTTVPTPFDAITSRRVGVQGPGSPLSGIFNFENLTIENIVPVPIP